MRIIADAMGGDKAPAEQIKGALMASQKLGIDVVLCGREDTINAELAKLDGDKSRISVVNCSEVIENEDDPVTAARRKKDSSMVVGLKMVRDGQGDAFVSSGSTGAVIAASIFTLKRIRGVSRPALAPIIPTQKGPAILLDAGANAVCKPENMHDFAIMGSFYMQSVMGIENPRVGLVNIGAEAHKGTPLLQESYHILENAPVNFVGNVEPRYILDSQADVLVADGFTGNVILKLIEGTAKFFFSNIKEMLYKNIITKISALALKGEFKSFKEKFDYKKHGGAPLMGVNGVVIKAHGSSDARAFYNAIKQAKTAVDGKLVEKITECLATVVADDNDDRAE